RQEYCLECGLRLPITGGVVGTLASAWRQRLPYYPGDWIWPVLVALVIAAIAAVVAIAATRGSGKGRTLVATHAPGKGRRPVTTTGRVLASSRSSSLHPGYYVVFSGVFTSLAAAQGALTSARSGGYPSAYARAITP